MTAAPDHTRSQVLVERALQRDSDAISELYSLYKDRLRAGLRKRLGTSYRQGLLDSEDAVQDGILAALHRIESFQYRGSGSFLAWLLTVAEHQVVERVRAMQAQKRTPQGSAGPHPLNEQSVAGQGPTASQVVEGQEAEVRLQRCLGQLSDREREILLLRRYLDLGFEEIREELQLPSAGAARALLSRAQVRLAILLEKA